MAHRQRRERLRYTKEQIAHAYDSLRAVVFPGTRVFTVLRRVSRSGMMRVISLFVPCGEDIVDISAWTAMVLNLPRDEDTGGIKIGGAGMDMGAYLVMWLGRALWPDGISLRLDEPPREGSYVLKHTWL